MTADRLCFPLVTRRYQTTSAPGQPHGIGTDEWQEAVGDGLNSSTHEPEAAGSARVQGQPDLCSGFQVGQRGFHSKTLSHDNSSKV